MYKEGETIPQAPEDQDWSFDVVRITYVSLNSIKSVLFTKLESSTSQRQTKITYKIDSRAEGNLMPFKIFKRLFPKATMKSLHTSENNSVILKMHNNSNIEQ